MFARVLSYPEPGLRRSPATGSVVTAERSISANSETEAPTYGDVSSFAPMCVGASLDCLGRTKRFLAQTVVRGGSERSTALSSIANTDAALRAFLSSFIQHPEPDDVVAELPVVRLAIAGLHQQLQAVWLCVQLCTDTLTSIPASLTQLSDEDTSACSRLFSVIAILHVQVFALTLQYQMFDRVTASSASQRAVESAAEPNGALDEYK
jgi:hypothetical protein